MKRRFRRVLAAFRERSYVSYAKLATIGGFCDVELIVVKATAPDDQPVPEKYIFQLSKIFSLSPSSSQAFSIALSRRFRRTRCWRVALKCLLLVHRLLPENSRLQLELLSARSNGLLSLYPCRFEDESASSSSCSADFTAFICSYARFLDEALECFPYCNSKLLEDEALEIGTMLKLLSQFESLIDRVIESRPPESVAVKDFLIWSAMDHLLRDSFTCYDLLKRNMILVLENLCQMPYNSCVAAFEVYKRGAFQANKLWEFYDWCRVMEFCESYKYPYVERIPEIQVRALEKLVNEMWQGTESPSSSPSVSTPTASPVSLLDFRAVIVTTKWEEFEDVCFPGKVEKESLIKWSDDGDDDGSWEDLLEASVNLDHRNVEEKDQWQMQVFNPEGLNPFLHPSDS